MELEVEGLTDAGYGEKTPERLAQRATATEPIERLNGEIKRRTEAVGILPQRSAIVRLVGAILLEHR